MSLPIVTPASGGCQYIDGTDRLPGLRIHMNEDGAQFVERVTYGHWLACCAHCKDFWFWYVLGSVCTQADEHYKQAHPNEYEAMMDARKRYSEPWGGEKCAT